MALWGSADAANNAPKFPIVTTTSGTPPLGNVAFGNTTPGAFVNNAFVTLVAANTGDAGIGKGVSPGWVKKMLGTGPLTALNIVAAGSGYANTDLVRVSGGQTNAAATIATHANGTINTLTITAAGRGFVNTASATVAITNATGGASGGSGANVTPTLGGRAGRINSETLVAFAGNMTGNAAVTTL